MATIQRVRDIVEGKKDFTDEEEKHENSFKILSYLYNIGLKKFPRQADVSNSNYLKPYIDHFLDLKLKPGLYAMDIMDIYHPIDNGANGIGHFVRHDSNDMKHNSIIAISEMRHTRLVFFQDYALLIIGIIETELGYRFLTNISGCLPVPALKIKNYVDYTFEEEEEEPVLNEEIFIEIDDEAEPVWN